MLHTDPVAHATTGETVEMDGSACYRCPFGWVLAGCWSIEATRVLRLHVRCQSASVDSTGLNMCSNFSNMFSTGCSSLGGATLAKCDYD